MTPEEQARLEYVHGAALGTRWQRLKAKLLCRHGHDPYLVAAIPFLFFDRPSVWCSRCGQRLLGQPPGSGHVNCRSVVKESTR